MTRLVYEYRDFVKSRMKSMDTLQEDLLHMTLGIAGESGDLVDAVKKYWAYGKPLNVNNVIEELGDLLFYIQGMLSTVTRQGALSPETLEDLMITNMDKLSKRYPTGYSDEAAIARADKEEPTDQLTFEDITPMTEAPEQSVGYWIVHPSYETGVSFSIWQNNLSDQSALRHRMAYLEKEHALVAARHIFGLKGGES